MGDYVSINDYVNNQQTLDEWKTWMVYVHILFHMHSTFACLVPINIYRYYRSSNEIGKFLLTCLDGGDDIKDKTHTEFVAAMPGHVTTVNQLHFTYEMQTLVNGIRFIKIYCCRFPLALQVAFVKVAAKLNVISLDPESTQFLEGCRQNIKMMQEIRGSFVYGKHGITNAE